MNSRPRDSRAVPGVVWPDLGTADLSRFRVTAPEAGLFDGQARLELLRATDDPTLQRAIEAARAPLPPPTWDPAALNPVGMIPRFYVDRVAWQAATRDLHGVEDTAARLAAAFLATGDLGHAEQLLDMLAALAGQEALTGFFYTDAEPQTWYAIEGTLIALGLSYAAVRPFLDGRSELPAIDAWLERAAREHLSVRHPSAWNNHHYRRALYAVAIGTVVDDDELFRFGIGAVLAALGELEPSGILPREIKRGRRALHYQNYALLYLIPILQLAERQGYSLWELAPAGRSIDAAIEVTVELLADPGLARRFTRRQQDLSFREQAQYFAWIEIVQARRPTARLEALIEPYRPVWSRLSIGAATLCFYRPATRGELLAEVG